jgi:hypothetical protein
LSTPDLSSGQDSREMLAKKASLLSPGADVLHTEWFSGGKRKAKGGP